VAFAVSAKEFGFFSAQTGVMYNLQLKIPNIWATNQQDKG
jgi:hypothetical protein